MALSEGSAHTEPTFEGPPGQKAFTSGERLDCISLGDRQSTDGAFGHKSESVQYTDDPCILMSLIAKPMADMMFEEDPLPEQMWYDYVEGDKQVMSCVAATVGDPYPRQAMQSTLRLHYELTRISMQANRAIIAVLAELLLQKDKIEGEHVHQIIQDFNEKNHLIDKTVKLRTMLRPVGRLAEGHRAGYVLCPVQRVYDV